MDSVHNMRAAARLVDEQHHESMRSFREQLGELHHQVTRPGFQADRRRFLTKAGAAGVVVAIGPSLIPVSSLLPTASAQVLDDASVAAFAQQLELAAVETYQAAAASGLLDAAVLEVGTLFASHHAEHAAVLADLAGDLATGEALPGVRDSFVGQIQEAPDQTAVLGLAKQLEEAASSTYQFALGVLSADAAAAVSTVLPVEAQHATVIGSALGLPLEEVVPVYQTWENAVAPDGVDPEAAISAACAAEEGS